MPTLLARVRSYWRRLRRGAASYDETGDEFQLHLELRAEDLVRSGLSPTEAARRARLEFGSRERYREEAREAGGVPWMEDLFRDVRHAIRSHRRAPVFASVVILTLALGIGANTAILSVVNGVLLRPLEYPRPEQLMYLAAGEQQLPVSVPEYLEFQRFNHSFAEVGAFRMGEANLMAGDGALRVRAAFVDPPLLGALGLRPAEGRLFSREDAVATAPAQPGGSALTQPVALISYRLWRSSYGGQSIVGQSVQVDGRRLEVVGVLEREVDLMDNKTDIWLPLGFTDDELVARNNHNLYLIGRLRAGVTQAEAEAELADLAGIWAARVGITPADDDGGHVFGPPTADGPGHMVRMTALTDQVLGRAGRSIWVLQAAVGLVLLIACANVANLLVARAETRQREMAMHTALGASRGRLVRKAVIESVVLSLVGGALGVLLARLGVALLVRAYPASLPRIGEVSVDMRVMLVSLAGALACGLIFGLVPMHFTRADSSSEMLKSGSRGTTGSTGHRLRRALVTAETALAVIVIVGAGLLIRTVENLNSVDSGFDRSRLLTFSITLPRPQYTTVPRIRGYQTILEELRAAPGVTAASAMTGLPLDREFQGNQTEITNDASASGPSVAIDYQRVMSDFFETMRVPILQGRGFQSADAAAEGGLAVVNETMANTHWAGRDPIGQRLRPAGSDPWFTVIGVAKDVKQAGIDQPVGAEAYLLIDQLAIPSPKTWVAVSPTTMHFAVRTTLPLATLAPTIARVIRDLDPAVPVAGLREMDEVFNESIRRPRALAQLLTVFSTLSLLLAAIGTYGVLAYMVVERRREMGIRLALGAKRSQLLRQVMTQGLVPTGIGLAAGLVGAAGLSRLLTSLLFGVRPADVTTLAIVVPLVVGTAALACWLPAWRASRLDPNLVLRDG